MVIVQRKLSGPLNFAALVLRPPLRLLGTNRWRGAENLPARGGALIACNHLSWADPIALLDFLVSVGPVPRVLAKQPLFDSPLSGWLLRHLGAVPVVRGSADAALALKAATDALLAGDRVVIFTDGTLSKDPAGWPMVGKTGVARLALATGVPVIPVAQWGSHRILPRVGRPSLWPRIRLDVLVGEAVDLSAFEGLPLTQDVLRRATDTIVDAIVALLEDVRQEVAPPRWDPRSSTRRAG